MKSLLTILLALALSIPATCAADELDNMLDDLILERESKVRAQLSRKKVKTNTVVQRSISAFPQIQRFSNDKATRSENSGVVAFETTYYPVRAGTRYHVAFTYSLKRAGASNYSKMKDLALLFNRSARIDGLTIDGRHAAFIGSRGDRASGIIIAIDSGSYLTIRSASPINRETLSRFAAHFSAQDLLRLKRSYGI